MRKTVFWGLMLLLTSVPALAASPHYTFVEVGLQRVDPDFGSSDNGWFLGGSFGLKHFQVFAEFADVGSFEAWRVGGGWHGLLGTRADLVAEGAYLDADFDDGYVITFGARWMIIERLELNGFLNYTDVGRSSDTTGELNALWFFAKRLAVGAGFTAGDDGNTARAFVRFNIGKR